MLGFKSAMQYHCWC